MDTLKNFFSRKFLVALAVIGSGLHASGMDHVTLITVAVVAAVYILAEAVIDHSGKGVGLLPSIASAIPEGIALAEKAIAAEGDAPAPTTSAPVATTPPASTTPAASAPTTPATVTPPDPTLPPAAPTGGAA